MKIARRFSFVLPTVLLVVYTQLFFIKEDAQVERDVMLTFSPPVQSLQILGHTYMRQMIADLLFIKVAVFYGGGNKISKSVEAMTQHFVAMNKLNPRMVDFYYRAEAALPDKGRKYAQITNTILKEGRVILPEEVVLPFFEGFNYYYYLNEPIKAAKILRLVSTSDEKYQWLGHLASMLEAEGGSIRAGLVWLKGVYQSLEEGGEKERYAEDIRDFENALLVEVELESFKDRFGRFPETLMKLEETGLFIIPKLSKKFKYRYYQHKLSLLKVGERSINNVN